MCQGADKSLARLGRKQATATELWLLQATWNGSNDLLVGWKMATFQLFFQWGRAKDLSAPLYYVYTYTFSVLIR
jgi:hypothetical protein